MFFQPETDPTASSRLVAAAAGGKARAEMGLKEDRVFVPPDIGYEHAKPGAMRYLTQPESPPADWRKAVLEFLNDLRDPEAFGHAVSAEVRDKARQLVRGAQ